MARKSITKSKPVTKIRKYQTGSMYQQVTNPYYISGSYREQAKLEADRAMQEAARFGDYSKARAIEAEVKKKEQKLEEEKAVKETNQQIAAQNQQELDTAATDALATGTELTTSYLKKRAAQKTAETTAEKAGLFGLNAASSTVQVLPTLAPRALSPTVGTLSLQGVQPGLSLSKPAISVGSGTFASQMGTVGGKAGEQIATKAAGTGSSIGAGLATAGIGLGLNIGGTLLEKSGDDNDFRTFTAKEKDRNLIGSAMKSAGTGVGIGATIGSFVPIPGVGTVVGGAIGGLVGGGIGLIKGAKENKESKRIAEEYKQEQERIEKERAEYEKKRQAEILKQTQLMANAANRGFVGSRLQGLNTGFGYNTSTNMNTQPTSSFYGKTGGKLPGGHVVPIGDDAVKFIGRKHSEGGIKLDPRTEVEGGETMDKVMMNGGKPNDYFFSAYLKLGGKSFAKRHEELVKAGASQKEIQQLAKMQESVANKKGEKDRGPEQIAKYGGIHKYQTAGQLVAGPTGKPVYKPVDAMTNDEYDTWMNTEGDSERAVAPNLPFVKAAWDNELGNAIATYDFGTKPPVERVPSRRPGPDSTAAEQVDSKGANTPAKSATAQRNTNAKNVTVRDQNQAASKAPSAQQSTAPGSKGKTTNSGQNAANTAAATTATKSTSTATTTAAKGQPAFGIRGGIKALEQVSNLIGIPKDKSVLSKEDEGGTSMARKDVPKGQHAGKKFYGNVTDMEYAGMVAANPWFDFTNFDPTNKDQVLKFQQEYNKRVKAGDKLKEDGKFGQQTATARLYKDTPAKPADATPGGYKTEVVDPSTMGPFDTTVTAEKEEPEIANLKRGVNGSLLAGLGQLIPVGYALARPYKTEGNLPRMQYAGNVGAGSVRGAILPRVNMNAERAAAERNTVAVKNAIQNTNAGPGGIAAMMAANTAQGNQMLAIANQEQEANKQLAAEEARMGQQASQFNVQTGLEAGKVNVANKLAVDQANLEAGIQEARLKIDEKRYKREEILGALDTAASRIAGIVKDERSYKAQERLAKAIDGTGSYDRFTIYEQLKKESKRKNSPYHGKTDAELRKIASNTYNEFAGKQGGEADETKKMGGRRYTSRLGDLNRGRNKRNFNI